MDGPHLLLSLKVDRVLSRNGPGFYMLGDERAEPRYVGRSDDNLGAALKGWAQHPTYHYFWFEHTATPREAYQGQCRRWHELGGAKGLLDNRDHPVPPADADWWCPACGER
ncbi:MAG TPA: hypothetical protein VJM69_02840 [Dehalococcoidia bacterium]|nr:hypothetical protein [Dehalococcoidia bacterium]